MSETPADDQLIERLAERGLRFTSQREQVYKALLENRDHPTAERVFMRTKQAMPEISLATVYNCLDALVKCRLVKEVNLKRGAARYCPNMREHYHFFCSHCGDVYDIDLPTKNGRPPIDLPSGFHPLHFEIAVRGYCPSCDGQPNPNGSAR